ncbi:MAG: family 10 glycosylhydrolase [Phycisphaerae bacterium]|nr:family 10 glycosylhydrolase [Phycisphaerae bacterium]
MSTPALRFHVVLAALVFALPAGRRSALADPPAFRAFWADVFHYGLQDQTQIDAMITKAVQGNYNAIIPEVLAYHDNEYGSHGAYWHSNIVTRSAYAAGAFDPLAYMVQQAHANGLEIHAWLVAYRLSVTWPPPGNSYLAAHPEWLMVPQASMGSVAAVNGIYTLDPGSPEVQEYLVSIVRELVSNYAIDGIHWDYIRYTQTDAGYPTDLSYAKSSLARFQQITGYSGTPSPSYWLWNNFRRRTIDELIRRCRAEIAAIDSNPQQPLRHTAALIAWGNAPASFTDSSAYGLFQNWEFWMREGYLDAGCPMLYYDETLYPTWYRNWVNACLNWRYDRHMYLGQAAYLNTMPNSVTQQAYSLGQGADGVVTYSYGTTRSDSTDYDAWYPYVATSLFTGTAATPTMPWRDPATATEGTLWGRVIDWNTGEGVDDATVQVGTLDAVQTDGNGYYVMTLVPATAAGTCYAATATVSGYSPETHTGVSVVAGDIRWHSFYVGTIDDCNSNDIPDECDTDCGAPGCDLHDCGGSPDANTNSIPDECEATVLFVDAAASGAANGTSWEDALPHLQDALAIASNPANAVEQIWVAKGTYMPDGGFIPPGGSHTPGCGDRTDTFQLADGVAIYGGFAGTEDPATFDLDDRDFEANETILSGDLDGDDDSGGDNSENAYRVVTGIGMSPSARLDGFTITAGNANAAAADCGGGMYNNVGSPTVANCRFIANAAMLVSPGRGAGVYNVGNCSPSFSACEFVGNHAYDGAGMCNRTDATPHLEDCQFTDNHATHDGAAMKNVDCSPVLQRCVFTENHADNNGGVMHNLRSAPELTDCTLQANTAVSSGAAIFGNESTVVTTDCAFVANSANVAGGGVYLLGGMCTISQCTFAENTADGGGAIAATAGGHFDITDTKIISNHASHAVYIWPSSSSMDMDRCILAGNQSPGNGGAAIFFDSGAGAINNSLIAGNTAVLNGSGLRLRYGGSATVTNCTFAENQAGGIAAGIWNENLSPASSVNVVNSILWDNADGGGTNDGESAQVWGPSAYTTVSYSDVQDDNPLAGIVIDGQNGNTVADPEFVGGPAGTWTDDADYCAPDDPDLDPDDPTMCLSGLLVGQTRLVDTGAGFAEDAMVGKLLNPDTTQAVQTLIAANTADTVTVWGDFSSFVPTGGPYPSYQIKDYHLVAASPCVDAGNNAAVPAGIDTDLDEDDRTYDGDGNGTETVDMGAYEYSASTLYVDASAGTAGNGLSWASAFDEIADAVAAVGSDTVEIRVADGTYSNHLSVPDGVAIRGGYAGQGAPDPDARDIDGFTSILEDYAYSSAVGSTLDGLTIRQSYLRVYSGDLQVVDCVIRDHATIASGPYSTAAGVIVEGGSPRFERVDVRGNTVAFDNGYCSGGGVYIRGAAAEFVDCRFAGNGAEWTYGGTFGYGYGGAVYVDSASPVSFLRCQFMGNRATFGGGLYTRGQGARDVIDCVFGGNIYSGILNVGTGPLHITNSLVCGNYGSSGGGMSCSNNTNTFVTNTSIVGNMANIWEPNAYGGGLSAYNGSVELTNVLLWANQAPPARGPQLAARNAAQLTVRYSNAEGGASDVLVENATLDWDTTDISGSPAFPSDYSGTWTANASYNASTHEVTLTDAAADWPAGGLIGKWVNVRFFPSSESPVRLPVLRNTATTVTTWAFFETVTDGWAGASAGNPYTIEDYRIGPGSACIDAGTNAADGLSGITTDLLGYPRFFDDPVTVDTGAGTPPIVDIGAYEFQGTVCNDPVLDADGDGDVDLTDFGAFSACFNGPNRLYAFGGDPAVCECLDEDTDGDVDLTDFGVFAACFNGPNRAPACE